MRGERTRSSSERGWSSQRKWETEKNKKMRERERGDWTRK